MKIQLKRSSVLDSGSAKVPTASQIDYGEIAINYNTSDPAIFIKDSNNAVVRIAGANHLGYGQVEVPSTASPPSNPADGNLWWNHDDGRLYIYYIDDNSSQWVDASPDSWDPGTYPDTTNNNPQTGTIDDRYINTYDNNNTQAITGTGGLSVAGGVYIGATNDNNKIDDASTGSSTTTLYIGNAAIQVSSDLRLKKNITNTQLNAVKEIQKIRVVDFEWNDPTDTSYNNRNARGKWTGIIAQELVNIFPFAVNAPRNPVDLSIDETSDEKWKVDQDQLVPVLIKAIQEQQSQIEILKSEVSRLSS
tara:strand:- start:670 stop:1584 length:915 start_codon:yes stop_codon:yes gene_type:complete